MEIDIEVKYDEMTEEYSRASDQLFRDIQKRFPESVWERRGLGYRISV
jgi:hypothetical protein